MFALYCFSINHNCAAAHTNCVSHHDAHLHC